MKRIVKVLVKKILQYRVFLLGKYWFLVFTEEGNLNLLISAPSTHFSF